MFWFQYAGRSLKHSVMFKKRLLWDLHGYSKSDVPTLFFKLIIFIYLFIHLFTENGKKNAGFRDNWADYQSEGLHRGGLTMRTLKAKLATRLKTFRGKAKTLKKKAQAGPRIWELSDQEVQKSSNQASERSNGFFYMPSPWPNKLCTRVKRKWLALVRMKSRVGVLLE